jgi:hypothetical protein
VQGCHYLFLQGLPTIKFKYANDLKLLYVAAPLFQVKVEVYLVGKGYWVFNALNVGVTGSNPDGAVAKFPYCTSFEFIDSMNMARALGTLTSVTFLDLDYGLES